MALCRTRTNRWKRRVCPLARGRRRPCWTPTHTLQMEGLVKLQIIGTAGIQAGRVQQATAKHDYVRMRLQWYTIWEIVHFWGRVIHISPHWSHNTKANGNHAGVPRLRSHTLCGAASAKYLETPAQSFPGTAAPLAVSLFLGTIQSAGLSTLKPKMAWGPCYLLDLWAC